MRRFSNVYLSTNQASKNSEGKERDTKPSYGSGPGSEDAKFQHSLETNDIFNIRHGKDSVCLEGRIIGQQIGDNDQKSIEEGEALIWQMVH